MANNLQEKHTFLGLIENQQIQIPIIQRDYAQGRIDPKVSEIREGFLSALVEALKTSDNSNPLILDFIYGSTINNNSLFIPLDGQQRLTTLFLLHWYLCPQTELTLPY